MNAAIASQEKISAGNSKDTSLGDDSLTVCAIGVVAYVIGDMLHEGIGHAALALLTGQHSGVLSTVAWSSSFDSRLVAAGGTLVNLIAAAAFWGMLLAARNASATTRFFLLITAAFNLFDGTGYFFFSGVTNFGDWAAVIAGMHPYWIWRTGLVVVGMASYLVAIRMIGGGLVKYVGVRLDDDSRLRKLTVFPYISAVVLAGVAGLMNPLGIQLVWQSALPSTAGANCGLLWMKFYIPKGTSPERPSGAIGRSYAWIGLAAVLTLIFVFVLGRGITLTR